ARPVPRPGPSRLPGDIAEHVAFVDFHRVGDLGARRFGFGGVEDLDDPAGSLNLEEGVRVSYSLLDIVIRPVAIPAQGVQIGTGEMHLAGKGDIVRAKKLGKGG